MGFQAVVAQVGLLGCVMLIGFLSVKTGHLPLSAKDGLSKIIIRLLLPALILSSIPTKKLTEDLVGEMLLTLVLSLGAVLCMFGAACLMVKLFRIPAGTREVHKALSTMGNVMFVGYPVVTAMFGEEVFVYYMVYWLVNDLFFWTVGIFLFSRKNQEKNTSLLNILSNPNTISFAIAVAMLLLGVQLPGLLQEAAAGIGSLTTHLSMLFIGMTLAGISLKNTLKKWWSLVLLPTKLVILPVLFLLLFRFLGIAPLICGAVVMGTAMPSGTVVTIAAHENGMDADYAAVGMFLTTVSCLVTLPLLSYLISLF